MMLVWDTGTSYRLTPFRIYIIDYVKFDYTVKGTTKVNKVIGIRTNPHKFIDRKFQDIFLPCISYHLTHTDLCLFYPHTYHKIYSDHSIVQGNQVTMHLSNCRIHIPIDIGGTNLLVVHNSFVTEHHNWAIGPQIYFLLAY